MLLFIIGLGFFEAIGLGLWFLLFKGNPKLKLILYTNLAVGIVFAWLYAVGWFFVLNPAYQSFWWNLMVTLVIYLMIDVPLYNFVTEYESDDMKTLNSKALVYIGSAIGIFVVVWFFTTSSVVRTDAVSHTVKIQEALPSLFKQISPEYVRLVPKKTAIMLADKTLGQVNNSTGIVLGSQLELDTEHATIQKIAGKMYWIIPLGYRGIFKQFSFGNIPGYIKVSAYDPTQKAQFVKGYQIRYSLDAYFDRWAKRKLWQHNVLEKLTDFSFEVDDSGKPYIVATIIKPAVGFGKYMPVGVKILDVQTGKIKKYSMKNIPKWVDRVVPSNLIAERLDEIGKWHNGVLPALFTGNGQWQLTDYGQTGKEMFFVEDGAGKTYWVSGVTSVGKDNSIIAIMAVDTRTGKTYKIPMSGPTELSVKQQIESQLGVNQQVWEAQLPILYNMFGKLTWVSVVVDKKRGFPIEYGLVDAGNQNHYAIGKDFLETVQKFFKKTIVSSIKKHVLIYSGTISRVNFVTNFAYIWADKKVWICDVKSFPSCGVLAPNDKVLLRGYKEGKVIYIDKIQNFSLK